ncbi:MAG: RNA polymerase sigma factor [Acidimicrobiia bacterium]
MRSRPAHGRSESLGDFEALLVAARANVPTAWDALFRWLAPGVAGYLRMSGAREVDDLTNEVLLAVFRRVGSFEGSEAKFRSWVFTVAHSRLIDERRRSNRQPVCALLDDGHVSIPTVTSAENVALRELEVARVEAICAQLPSDQRAVVLLRIIGELSVDQVAETLGKSPGAIKQLQRRGFEKARRLVEREGVTL